MKQHITVEQMKQVEQTTWDKLLNSKTFKLIGESLVYVIGAPKEQEYLSTMASIITIGKMIEILEQISDKSLYDYQPTISGYYRGAKDMWQVYNIDDENIGTGKELADALFEALLYVLGDEA